VLIPEATSLDELVRDCAELPESLLPPDEPETGPPQPREATPWRVDEACLARVRERDDYGS